MASEVSLCPRRHVCTNVFGGSLNVGIGFLLWKKRSVQLSLHSMAFSNRKKKKDFHELAQFNRASKESALQHCCAVRQSRQ